MWIWLYGPQDSLLVIDTDFLTRGIGELRPLAPAAGEAPMKHIKAGARRGFFEVLASTRSSQAAMMTIRPGQATGEPQNEHPRSEQWLFVVSGSGRALVSK